MKPRILISKELLDKGAKRAWEFIDEENYTQSEFVQEWRQAFSKFKTKKEPDLQSRHS